MLNVSISSCLIRRVIRGKKGSFEEADMARQPAASQSSKSIVGAALVGIGTLILYETLAGDVAQLRHVLDANGSDALGVLPAVVLATSQAVHACGFDYQALLPCLLRMLISFWPPLLVIAGTILLRDGCSDKVKEVTGTGQILPKKNFKNKDTECRFRCPSFDA
jgi:hypothetical protein